MLNIIPIVNLIVLGYTARIIRESPDEPTKLSDYWKLFVDGLLVFIAGLIYAIVPLVVLPAGFLMTGFGLRGFGMASLCSTGSGRSCYSSIGTPLRLHAIWGHSDREHDKIEALQRL